MKTECGIRHPRMPTWRVLRRRKQSPLRYLTGKAEIEVETEVEMEMIVSFLVMVGIHHCQHWAELRLLLKGEGSDLIEQFALSILQEGGGKGEKKLSAGR